MDCCNEGFIPKFKRHGGMSKKRKPDFDNMPMFSFCRPVLLVSMWARYMMSNTNALEKRVQTLILPTPISLHSNNFPIKQAFNKVLKIMETLENFRLVSKEKNPSEFAKIINKRHIIIVPPNRSWSWTPYIREDKVQGIIRHTKGLGIG
jgi:hypothetical protein